MDTIVTDFVERPQYYIELDRTLGDKYKVMLPHLTDTLESSPSTPPTAPLPVYHQ